MDVSAVVLSFNSRRYIETCVRSLRESYAQTGLAGEILVVENGSVDGSVDILQGLEKAPGAPLQVFYQAENTGTTRSRNRALRAARGRAILVLDSDAYMNPIALRGMLDYLGANPGVGLVAPKLTYPDGRFQLSVDVFPTVMRKLQRLWGLRELERREPPAAAGPVDYAISACWMLDANAIAATGLLDERIFYSPEDVDYCIRVWLAGWQIHYLPSATVVHDAQEISRPKGLASINKFTIRHAKGLAYLFFKHGYVFSAQSLYRRIQRQAVPSPNTSRCP
jgi:GT2 family glycosyltransferase